MSKKVFLLLGLAFVLVFMIGCNSGKRSSMTTEAASSQPIESEENVAITKADSKSLEQSSTQDNGETKNYKIKECTINEENAKISYPQIDKCDEKLTYKWNNIIKNKINEERKNLLSTKEYELKYEITLQTEEMLSIVFRGVLYDVDKNDPYYFAYTYNIDMKTGDNKKLSDFVSVDELAFKLYNGNGYTLMNADESDFCDYIINFFESENELSEMFNEYDYDESKTYSTGYSYRKDEKTYLCMEVNHDLGDYVEIEIEE